jgi:hypothetical protein
VVTPQLAQCFDRALSLVSSSVADRRSKATYLHASFGAGKTAMMSVLHLLLQGDPAARSVPELGSVVTKYADRIDQGDESSSGSSPRARWPTSGVTTALPGTRHGSKPQ